MLQSLRNSGAVTPWRSSVSQTWHIHCGILKWFWFFFTDEKIGLQYIGECEEVAELVLAAAIKLFHGVAMVTT